MSKENHTALTTRKRQYKRRSSFNNNNKQSQQNDRNVVGSHIDMLQRKMLAKNKANEKRALLMHKMDEIIDNALDIEVRMAVSGDVTAGEISFIQTLDRLMQTSGRKY